jgi:endonuclease/exonuclease/phosphatase family metal-dependent hydrolase
MVGVPARRVCAILVGVAASLALPLAATADGRSGTAEGTARASAIRVLTYNVLAPGTNPTDAVVSWANREPAIVRLVLAQGADIVGLQEVKRTFGDDAPADLVRDLANDGTGYRVVSPRESRLGSTVQTGWRSSPKLILYRAARFHLVAAGARQLPNPFDPGRPCFFKAANRSMTWALLRDRQGARGTARTYLVVNTHLTVGRPCWRGRNTQARAIEETVARIQQQRGSHFPQVVVGDFNTDPRVFSEQDRAVAMMTDHQGALQLRSSGPNGGTHLKNWPDPRAERANRIDYVLLSRSLRPLDDGVDDGRYGLPMTPSDHLGVWARFAPARG